MEREGQRARHGLRLEVVPEALLPRPAAAAADLDEARADRDAEAEPAEEPEDRERRRRAPVVPGAEEDREEARLEELRLPAVAVEARPLAGLDDAKVEEPARGEDAREVAAGRRWAKACLLSTDRGRECD